MARLSASSRSASWCRPAGFAWPTHVREGEARPPRPPRNPAIAAGHPWNFPADRIGDADLIVLRHLRIDRKQNWVVPSKLGVVQLVTRLL